MSCPKYVGFDVHKASISAAVRDHRGKLLPKAVFQTDAEAVRAFLRGLSGDVHLAFEEGTQAAWLFELCVPLVHRVVVCNPREHHQRRSKSKTDRIDAANLSLWLWQGRLESVYHQLHDTGRLKQLVRSYDALVKDSTRVKNRIKALYRSRAIACPGRGVFGARGRAAWLAKLPEDGLRTRAEALLRQLDALRPLLADAQAKVRREVRGHAAYPLLSSLPGFGPVRTAQAIVAMVTPHRFRRDRQLWAYAGLSVVTRTSAEWEVRGGELERRERRVATRGLRRECNWRLKEVFKGAAETAIRRPPYRARYERLVARGLKESIARVQVARHLATLALTLWKKGECFDASRVTG
jgi:transposase